MSGEQRIEAPRARVWAALNNPEVLKDCIPGCQTLTQTAPDRMQAVAAIKVGPIGARFRGEVVLSQIDAPNGYRIDGEGQGGVAGFARGGAQVRLAVESAPAEAVAAGPSPIAPTLPAPVAQATRAPHGGLWWALMVLAALATGYIFGRNGSTAGGPEGWQALATGLLAMLAGVLGYWAGRDRAAAAPVVVVDAALLSSLQQGHRS